MAHTLCPFDDNRQADVAKMYSTIVKREQHSTARGISGNGGPGSLFGWLGQFKLKYYGLLLTRDFCGGMYVEGD